MNLQETLTPIIAALMQTYEKGELTITQDPNNPQHLIIQATKPNNNNNYTDNSKGKGTGESKSNTHKVKPKGEKT